MRIETPNYFISRQGAVVTKGGTHIGTLQRSLLEVIYEIYTKYDVSDKFAGDAIDTILRAAFVKAPLSPVAH